MRLNKLMISIVKTPNNSHYYNSSFKNN